MLLPNHETNCCHDSTGTGTSTGPRSAMPTNAVMSVRSGVTGGLPASTVW